MTGTLQPLDQKFAIVDRDGNPTEYFTRWAQQKQIDIGDSITLTDLQAYLAAHPLIAGTGIQFAPDGNINDHVTIHADAQAILDEITATRGAVLYRGSLGWAGLLPGAAGQFLQTAGAGADPLWAAASGGGGAGSTVGFSELTSQQSPGVNNYIMAMAFAPDNFTINKVAFVVGTASPTCKYQPFVYVGSVNGIPGALLATGPQITGTVAGYNEAPLAAPLVITKGQLIFMGCNPTVAGFTGLWTYAGARGGFAANGGSTVPAASAPALTFGQAYGFWGVA